VVVGEECWRWDFLYSEAGIDHGLCIMNWYRLGSVLIN
jgi:hypothetical protein